MMLNVQELSARLSMMADPALQQYAAMHKDDPYVLAMAVSESNRRRQVRAAQQGVAGAQPQPTVADQEVAQMNAPVMPEQVGIGALPAPALAGMPSGGIAGEEEQAAPMAGGGLVAFAGGGDVERYSGEFGSFVAADEGLANYFAKRQAELQRQKEAERQQQLEFLSVAAPDVATRVLQQGNVAPPVVSAMEQERARNMAAVAASGSPTDPNFRRRPDPRAAGITYGADAGPAAPTAPGAPKPPAGAGSAPATPSLNVEKLTAEALKTAAATPNPFASDQKKVGEEKVRAAEEAVTGLENIHKQFSDIYKGRKERLDTREAELGKMKDQGLGLALLQAGAAMMTTPGGLGVALGKGVKVGSEQYAAGVERLRSAQEKLMDARDRLEEVEAQRGEMSARELFKARNEVKNVGIAVQEDMIKSNMQMFGVNRETAMKMVDNQVKIGIAQLDAQSRERAAARNPQLEMLQAVKKDPALAQAYQSLHGTKNDLMAQYTDYIKSNPTASIEDFLKAKAVFSTLGAATRAPVTNPPPGAVAPRAP